MKPEGISCPSLSGVKLTDRLENQVDPESVEEELREAKRIFHHGGFQVIDMTDKPIELGADEIQRRVTPRR